MCKFLSKSGGVPFQISFFWGDLTRNDPKGRYGMFESVTQMLEQLTWIPLSKRRENSRLILFYKIINNLAVVPHSCLKKADVRTRKTFSKVPPHRLQH